MTLRSRSTQPGNDRGRQYNPARATRCHLNTLQAARSTPFTNSRNGDVKPLGDRFSAVASLTALPGWAGPRRFRTAAGNTIGTADPLHFSARKRLAFTGPPALGIEHGGDLVIGLLSREAANLLDHPRCGSPL